MKNKTLIIIAGATSSGKTSFALKLASDLNTSIISADSRHCFKELNIGVAKPTAEELNAVKHYFINSHSIKNEVNAATFETYALAAANEIFETNDVAIMVGGTGLYIKAFCEGLDAIPEIPKSIRDNIIANFEKKGIEFLHNELKEKDPEFLQSADRQNPQRLIRALEVIEATDKSIRFFQSLQKKKRDFIIKKFSLELPKEKLYHNINTRVDRMIEAGLVDEVKNLLPYKKLNALQTVGYKEIFSFFENKISLAKAIEEIKTNTRHYAKRQLTWFKKDKEFQWITDFPGTNFFI